MTLEIVLGCLLLLIATNAAFSRIANWRNPPVGQFIEIDGVRLHYIERGKKTSSPLVLLHGNGAFLQDMTISGLVDAAAAKFRVVCFDRPGFGHSSRPRLTLWTPERQAVLIAKALLQLDVTNPIVLGHSWGASVALALGLHHADRIRGLVLVSGYYFPTWRWDVWFASGPAVPILGDLLRYTISPLIGFLILPGLFKKLFAPREVPDVVSDEYPKSLFVKAIATESCCRRIDVYDSGCGDTRFSLHKDPLSRFYYRGTGRPSDRK